MQHTTLLRGTGGDRERGHRRAAFWLAEPLPYRPANRESIEVARDDVGEHRRTFLERHVSDDIRLGRTPHHAVGIDRAPSRGFHPLGFAPAERAIRAWVPM